MKKCCSRCLCLKLGSKTMVEGEATLTPSFQKMMSTTTKEIGKFYFILIYIIFDIRTLQL